MGYAKNAVNCEREYRELIAKGIEISAMFVRTRMEIPHCLRALLAGVADGNYKFVMSPSSPALPDKGE